jgi:hypothetical protein
MAGIVFFLLLAFAMMAGGGLFATDSHAYQRYNGGSGTGCQTCHGAFTDSTSPKGTNFGAAGSKHDMHRSSSFMGTACGLCHVVTGDNPLMNSSAGSGSVVGVGCTGCHNAAGLRQHHRVTGASQCSGCHASPEVPPAENTNPPYYGTSATKANNACNPVATALLNENWSVGDFEGLDNDGDNLYDTNDPDCASVTAGPLTVTPAGGLTSSGTVGGSFSPSSQTYTLTNTGTASMNWTASNAQSWVTLSAAVGTLAAGATTTVTASINSVANSLAAGSYSDNVIFTNTTNGTGNATRPVSLTVNAAEAPTISTVSLPAGAVDTAYNQTLTATGGTIPYTWSVSSGTLPVGLSLSATGVLDGTPTTAESSSFTVRVEGANGASSTKDFSLTINAAAPPPSLDLSSDSGGGSCSVAVRTGSGGSAIDGTLILAGLGMTVWGIRLRRRRR